jgi:hypothetical protein
MPPGIWAPVSHFSGLFHGMLDSGRASGSLINAVCGFSVAQEEKLARAALIRAIVRQNFRRRLRFGASSINDRISRLHLDAARQATGDNIAYGSCRFN